MSVDDKGRPTEADELGNVPTWDIADRMRKSLRYADVSVQEMADYLDVSRNSVSSWINGRINPSARTLRLWALRTGVDYDWLRDADGTSPPFRPDGGTEADPAGNSRKSWNWAPDSITSPLELPAAIPA